MMYVPYKITYLIWFLRWVWRLFIIYDFYVASLNVAPNGPLYALFAK